MSTKILCVDDEEHVLAGLQRSLRKKFQLDVAMGPKIGLEQLEKSGPYAVVLVDMQMPGMNGIEFLKRVETMAPDTVRVMLTGNADQKTAVDAVNQGHVFRFLNKPCEPEGLESTLHAALRQYELIRAEKELLEMTLNGAVKILTDVLTTIDARSFGQAQKLRDYMRLFLRTFPVQNAWELEIAAMMAFIGRVTVPPAVLLKDASGLSLTNPEKEMILRVPEVGAGLLANIPRLENVAKIVRFQAKNFDGTGLPREPLAGESLPIGSRVLRVLIELVRAEARGLNRAALLSNMPKHTGVYDPAVVKAACECFDVALPEPPPGQTRVVRLNDLHPGLILAEDIKSEGEVLILASGTKLTPVLLERLRNFLLINSTTHSILVYGL